MNFEDIEVRINEPYPEIENATADLKTVAVLKNLASSSVGELEAVLTYIYQSIIANKTHKDIANLLEEIAIVEMEHMDMLMNAITAFGGVPKYEDCNGTMYSTKFINYTQKLSEMLNNNIAAENIAIKDYTQAINLVSNDSLIKLFERIIMDEKRHIEIFKTVKDCVQFLSI